MNKQKVNILFVITKLELGGAQKRLLRLISYLDQDKYRIYLFTADKGLLLEEARAIPGLILKSSLFLERPINIIKDLLALAEIYLFIKKNNIDIVHTHSSKAGILGRLSAKLAGVKLIVHTVHGWSFNDYQPKLKKKIFIKLEQFCGALSSKIIVVSRHDLEKGLSNRIARAEKYELISYGVSDEACNRFDESLREELGISRDELVVGSIACFKPQKSPFDFIRLARLVTLAMPDVKFILAGDGQLRKTMENLIAEWKLEKQIILLGWRRDIPRVLASMDIFVLTSLWEGLPIVVLEAAQHSLPVVVTDTGGVSEVISQGQTGFLVKPQDMAAMADKVIVLLKDRNLRQFLGKNAKSAFGQAFTVEKMAVDTARVYDIEKA